MSNVHCVRAGLLCSAGVGTCCLCFVAQQCVFDRTENEINEFRLWLTKLNQLLYQLVFQTSHTNFLFSLAISAFVFYVPQGWSPEQGCVQQVLELVACVPLPINEYLT